MGELPILEQMDKRAQPLRSAKSAWASCKRAGLLRKSQAVKVRILATEMAFANAVSVMAVSHISLEWEGTGVSLTAYLSSKDGRV